MIDICLKEIPREGMRVESIDLDGDITYSSAFLSDGFSVGAYQGKIIDRARFNVPLGARVLLENSPENFQQGFLRYLMDLV